MKRWNGWNVVGTVFTAYLFTYSNRSNRSNLICKTFPCARARKFYIGDCPLRGIRNASYITLQEVGENGWNAGTDKEGRHKKPFHLKMKVGTGWNGCEKNNDSST